MTIKKYPQSCVMIETLGKKILFDPGNIAYTEQSQKEWETADAVFITHFHPDHCYDVAVNKLLKAGKRVYASQDVVQRHALDTQLTDANGCQLLTILDRDDNAVVLPAQASKGKANHQGVQIKPVNAIHGFIGKEMMPKQNFGYIVDDGSVRVYITGDCIRFDLEQDKHCRADIVLANVCAFDASMNLFGAVETTKQAGAKTLVVLHQDAGRMFFSKEQIQDYLALQDFEIYDPKAQQKGYTYVVPQLGNLLVFEGK